MRTKELWTKEQLQQLFDANQLACERALLALYKRQTLDEQTAEATIYHNGEGFCPYDADIFTSFVRNTLMPGRHLTPKQLAVCRRVNARGVHRLAKYHRQLNEVIIERQAEGVA